jgi:hypothetical protein
MPGSMLKGRINEFPASRVVHEDHQGYSGPAEYV